MKQYKPPRKHDLNTGLASVFYLKEERMQKLHTRPNQGEDRLVIPIAGQEFEVAPLPKTEHSKLIALIDNIDRIGRGKRTRGFQTPELASANFQGLTLGKSVAGMRNAGLNKHQINVAAAVAAKWHLEGLETTQAAWSERTEV